MITFLTTGTILGLSAGFTPGPLTALVISETLQHDMKAGIKVSLAPILTDLPIILLTVFILGKLSNFHTVLGVISFSGGFLLLKMGYENMRTKGVTLRLHGSRPQSLKKGIIVNVLSPHPYLFWLSVGGPTTIKAMDQSTLAAVAFIVSFYGLLVAGKIFIAVLANKSRSFLTGPGYIYTMRSLGLLLFAFAAFLFHDGLKLIGLLR